MWRALSEFRGWRGWNSDAGNDLCYNRGEYSRSGFEIFVILRILDKTLLPTVQDRRGLHLWF
ncbi:MAG TPA: hypothetical protein PLC82_14225, partial [Smithellaceae bacterium]|nr:hypothetical protein [Smithellaceae bacterium]